jgi:hypothetical protein
VVLLMKLLVPVMDSNIAQVEHRNDIFATVVSNSWLCRSSSDIVSDRSCFIS